MPRYYFDTFDGERTLQDEVGVELPDLATAKAEAQRALPDMAREVLRQGSHSTFVVSVRDEAGRIWVRAALSMVVEEGDVDG